MEKLLQVHNYILFTIIRRLKSRAKVTNRNQNGREIQKSLGGKRLKTAMKI